jgi:hypothetical protein
MQTSSSTYQGWLVSTNFWKRAIAVWGHYIAVQLLITGLILSGFITLSILAPFLFELN